MEWRGASKAAVFGASEDDDDDDGLSSMNKKWMDQKGYASLLFKGSVAIIFQKEGHNNASTLDRVFVLKRILVEEWD